jgi:hypothetical protein
MKITESRLRNIIRQVIKESYGEENLHDRDEKEIFTDLFVKKLDEDTLRDELVTIGHKISDRLDLGLDLGHDAYTAALFTNEFVRHNAIWSRDNMGECGYLLVKAEPYQLKFPEPDYYAVVRVEIDHNNIFLYDIVKMSENIKEVLVEFKKLMS